MKTSIAIIGLSCLTSLASCGAQNEDDSALGIAQRASAFVQSTRTSIASKFRLGIDYRLVTERDLRAIIEAVDRATNAMKQAGFDVKLAHAAERVETVRSGAASILTDPDNKAMALGLQPDQWLNQIALSKSQCDILWSDLLRMRNVVEEIRNWVSALHPVAPPEQLSDRIKTRLGQLLIEWEHQAPSAKAPKAADMARNGVEASHEPKPVIPLGHTGLVTPINPQNVSAPGQGGTVSPAVKRVMGMAEAKVPETVVLAYIQSSPQPFLLTNADQIISAKNSGLTTPMIKAMMDHDQISSGQAKARNAPAWYVP